jgi:hypothetical protein
MKINFRDILLRILSFGLLSEAKENSYIHCKFISNQENLQSILNDNNALIAISGHPSKPVLIDEYDFSNLPELEPKIVENDETYILVNGQSLSCYNIKHNDLVKVIPAEVIEDYDFIVLNINQDDYKDAIYHDWIIRAAGCIIPKNLDTDGAIDFMGQKEDENVCSIKYLPKYQQRFKKKYEYMHSLYPNEDLYVSLYWKDGDQQYTVSHISDIKYKVLNKKANWDNE